MKLLPKTPATKNDGLGRGAEFAMLVLLFLGIGYAMDHWLDTKPVFMIVWFSIAVIGQFISMWYQYNGQMEQLEAERSAQTQARVTNPQAPVAQ
jgi:F0F1-type ATP synthase assembly protein I